MNRMILAVFLVAATVYAAPDCRAIKGTPAVTPAPGEIVGLGADATRVRAVDSNGTPWTSGDDGASWQRIGPSPVGRTLVYHAAVEPNQP